MAGSNFKSLDAWKGARKLVKPIYELTRRFPDSERYVLVLQMQKAVHSVHMNIAEGSGRLSNGEWQHFLGQSRRSLLELESAMVSVFDLEYCSQDEATALSQRIQEVTRMVNGLLRASTSGHEAKKFAPKEK